MDGWIKLHRRLLSWEWHKDANTLSVFVHLLLLAAHQPHEVDGITLQAGQVLASRANLCQLTGITDKRVRNALQRLIIADVIRANKRANKRANGKTLITFCNWDTYQGLFLGKGQQKGQQKGQVIQESIYQELVGVKGACVRACEDSATQIEQLRSQLQTSPLKQEKLQRCTRLPLADALRLADEVFNDWAFQDEPPSGITLAHLLAVIRIKAERERQQPQDLQTWKQQEAARANQELSAYFSQFKNPKN